jgi:hypothetical protein
MSSQQSLWRKGDSHGDPSSPSKILKRNPSQHQIHQIAHHMASKASSCLIPSPRSSNFHCSFKSLAPSGEPVSATAWLEWHCQGSVPPHRVFYLYPAPTPWKVGVHVDEIKVALPASIPTILLCLKFLWR